MADLDRSLLEPLVRPFDGPVYCHVPADAAFDPEALAHPDDGRDRWSSPGMRTAYLSSDPLVAIAEYARHGPANGQPDDRRLFRLSAAGLAVLDVRGAEVRAAVGLAELRPDDIAGPRAASEAIRSLAICDGLLVPSMAFLDRPDEFNVVIFRERLRRPIGDVLCNARVIGRVSLEADG